MKPDFVPYNTSLKWFARSNRKAMTKTEWLVRHCILKWDKTWYRRLRQKPVWNYILDFYCAQLKLCIEIDGESHNTKQDQDDVRNQYLQEHHNIKTIRYTNDQVDQNLQGVADDINIQIKQMI
jgi:very-short-patch-repair endonuclease